MAADVAVPALSSEEAAEVLAQPPPLAAFWAAFRENRGAVFGLVVISAIALIAIFADFLAPHSPIEQFRDAVRAPPVWDAGGTWRFALGTDGDGHDMLSRLIYGARVSLFIGLSVMSVSFVVGVVLGLLGRFGGVAGRRRHHPRHGPDHGGAEPGAGDPGRRDPRPESRQHHRRGDDRLSAALRPAGARLGARRADQGLCHRRARRRRRAAAADVRDRAAELPRAADRAGGARRLRRHPRSGGPRLPRPRRAAADAGMGHDARRLARVHPLRPVDRRAARPGDPHHRRRDQPDRRRAARRARSQNAAD